MHLDVRKFLLRNKNCMIFCFRMEAFQQLVGERIGLARKEAALTQDELSQKLGFKDRQILSNIESGKRNVSTHELLLLMRLLNRPLDYFTDPTLVVGEGIMSWRTTGSTQETQEFEEWALALVGTMRQLGGQLREPECPLRLFLPLSRQSRYEEAMDAAERLVLSWSIGPAPAAVLRESIEEQLRIFVLPVDAPDHVSGGAVNLPELSAIFFNRKHARGRRHFTIAHELFHILTWHSMPPDRLDLEKDRSGKAHRVEKLADNFAAALLMPKEVLLEKLMAAKTREPDSRPLASAEVPSKSWFKQVAEFFQVSVHALKFRLVNSGLLLASALASIDLNIKETLQTAPAFGSAFLKRLNRGIDLGLISIRKAASILRVSTDDLAALMRANGLQPSFSV